MHRVIAPEAGSLEYNERPPVPLPCRHPWKASDMGQVPKLGSPNGQRNDVAPVVGLLNRKHHG